ncbi:MAG: sensor histidine kinase [Peptococcaceae bacterium]
MRFSSKLSLVLITTVLAAGIIISAFSLEATKSFFAQYIFKVREGQLEQWARFYTEYYAQNNGWGGLTDSPDHRGRAGMMMGRGPGMGGQGVVLTDARGQIIQHPAREEIGNFIHENLLDQGRPIKADNTVVGYLFPGELFIPAATELEQRFISSVLYAVITGTIITSIIASIIGIVWSRKITKPIEALALAAKKVAKGDFSGHISFTSQDELGTMAQAFNTMAGELDKSQQIKKQLFADISHELRTPLTILGSGLESALEEGKSLPPLQVSSLYDEVIRLQGLVKELQDLGRIEAGQVGLEIRQVKPREITDDLKLLLEAEAEARKIKLNIAVSEKLAYIKADPHRLKQIILNLLSNAFRYTNEGGQVTLKMFPEENTTVITVSDTGPGIKNEDLPYIFQRFYRADKSRNRTTGGTGLGLAITKGYVEAHGGKIEAASQVGKGTKFTVKLPG